MTEFFIRGMLVIGIASAVLCVVMAAIEIVRIFMGRDDD
jgi:hypothetical protein